MTSVSQASVEISEIVVNRSDVPMLPEWLRFPADFCMGSHLPPRYQASRIQASPLLLGARHLGDVVNKFSGALLLNLADGQEIVKLGPTFFSGLDVTRLFLLGTLAERATGQKKPGNGNLFAPFLYVVRGRVDIGWLWFGAELNPEEDAVGTLFTD